MRFMADSLTSLIERHGTIGGFSLVSYPRPERMTDEDYASLPLEPDLPALVVAHRCDDPNCICQVATEGLS